MSNKKMISEEVVFDDYIIEDYHQYLHEKMQKNPCKQINKKENNTKPKKDIKKQKKEEDDTIQLNENWGDEDEDKKGIKALKPYQNINKKVSDCEDESEDENFTRALNKRAFQGKKGQMLMELQKSYKGDDRFIMDKKFQGDIDVDKVSQKLKDMTYTFDEKNLNKESRKINFTKKIDNKAENKRECDTNEEINIIANNLSVKNFSEAEFKEKLEEEKMKNLSILSSIISNQEFLSLSKKINNPSQLLVKRFDPSLNIGQNLIVEKEKKKIEESKNLVKLGKGMELKSDFNIQQEYSEKNNKKEMRKLNQLRKDEKERVMKKIANEVNDDLEPVIEVNYDIWKNVSKNKTKYSEGFSLFSNEEKLEKTNEHLSKSNNNEDSKTKKTFSLFGDDEDNNKSNERKGFSLFDEVRPNTKIIEKDSDSQKNKNVLEETNKNKLKNEIKNKDKNKDKDDLDLNTSDKKENKKDLKDNKRLIETNIESIKNKEKDSSIKTDKKQKEPLADIEKGTNKELDLKVKEKTTDYELLKKKRERIKEEKEALKREEIKKKEKMDRKFENKLLQNFDKDKVDKYIRYIDMCREKRNPKKK